MLTSISFDGFQAVKHLESTSFMQQSKTVTLATDRPNIIVGPNGSGKSSFLDALSMLTLTYYMDVSTFDQHYISMADSDRFWEKPANIEKMDWWKRHDNYYLTGLSYTGDLVPTLYYRPNRLPGNEHDVAHSMCMGYSEPAREYGNLTRDKSSGQRSRAIQDRMLRVLEGEEQLRFENYRFSDPDVLVKQDPGLYTGEQTSRSNLLKTFYKDRLQLGNQLVIMDEPEQSLDLEAEINLWKTIAGTYRGTQVICATHSLYPILNPEPFNLIETVPGYVERVQALLNA